MKNPCDKCLVSQMCEKECDKLVSYLRELLTHQFGEDEDYERLAHMLKIKAIQLSREGDTEKDETTAEWRWDDD